MAHIGEPQPFPRGEAVLHRMPFVVESGSQPPIIGDVRPMVVVEDSEALTSLWIPAGTPTKLTVPLVEGTPRPWLDGECRVVDATWDRWNMLSLKAAGQWRATWVMWTPDWEFLGWYVNLEEPSRRTTLGFDTRDLWLDIVVERTRTWRWKDEDELERAIERGIVSASVAGRARAEGEAAIAGIERGDWPFTDDIRDWRPDPAWPAPTLGRWSDEELLAVHDEAYWSNPRRL